jgi:hypothetical protein
VHNALPLGRLRSRRLAAMKLCERLEETKSETSL